MPETTGAPKNFNGRAILLDIEGTTSSVSYVFDVLFPYVRRELENFLIARWDSAELREVCEQIARDAGARSFQDWCGTECASEAARDKIAAEVFRLMDRDAKTTGLKAIQGMVWERGFKNGTLRSHVYPDVPEALTRWKRAGLDVRIYSSGSIAAQKLFFGHTEAGNLLEYINGHYDTTFGQKKSLESYSNIVKDMRCSPAAILFLSDIVAELDAAHEAGLQTALVVRPGNAPAQSGHAHRCIKTFDEV